MEPLLKIKGLEQTLQTLLIIKVYCCSREFLSVCFLILGGGAGVRCLGCFWFLMSFIWLFFHGYNFLIGVAGGLIFSFLVVYGTAWSQNRYLMCVEFPATRWRHCSRMKGLTSLKRFWTRFFSRNFSRSEWFSLDISPSAVSFNIQTPSGFGSGCFWESDVLLFEGWNRSHITGMKTLRNPTQGICSSSLVCDWSVFTPPLVLQEHHGHHHSGSVPLQRESGNMFHIRLHIFTNTEQAQFCPQWPKNDGNPQTRISSAGKIFYTMTGHFNWAVRILLDLHMVLLVCRGHGRPKFIRTPVVWSNCWGPGTQTAWKVSGYAGWVELRYKKIQHIVRKMLIMFCLTAVHC